LSNRGCINKVNCSDLKLESRIYFLVGRDWKPKAYKKLW